MLNTLAKAACLAGALTGAAALSQYPAFTQQYIQRLGGTVDALAEVVRDFDNSALEAGITRGAALSQLTGTAFLEARATDMRRTFARHVILTDQLSRLRSASAMERIWLAPQLRDPETLKATWLDYEPAVPVTAAGAATGGIGFLGGWFSVVGLLALLGRVLRRKSRRQAPQRIDPPVLREDGFRPTPRLMGETRP